MLDIAPNTGDKSVSLGLGSEEIDVWTAPSFNLTSAISAPKSSLFSLSSIGEKRPNTPSNLESTLLCNEAYCDFKLSYSLWPASCLAIASEKETVTSS